MRFLIFDSDYGDDPNNDIYIYWAKMHKRNYISSELNGRCSNRNLLLALHDNEEVLIDRGLLDPSQRFYVP